MHLPTKLISKPDLWSMLPVVYRMPVLYTLLLTLYIFIQCYTLSIMMHVELHMMHSGGFVTCYALAIGRNHNDISKFFSKITGRWKLQTTKIKYWLILNLVYDDDNMYNIEGILNFFF